MIIALIPAYKEKKSIGEIVRETCRFVDSVIVCDDGSKDRTAEIAEENGAIIIKHKQNQGKGAALKTLFNYAKRKNVDIAVTLDADGQHDPKEIPFLIQPIIDQTADIIAGSRFLSQNLEMPLYRRIGNKILNLFVNLTHEQIISDTQCGYRAYSRKAIQLIEITTNKIGQVDSEIIMTATSLGLKILEVPISCKYEDIRSSTYNPVKYFISVIFFVISIRTKKLLENYTSARSKGYT